MFRGFFATCLLLAAVCSLVRADGAGAGSTAPKGVTTRSDYILQPLDLVEVRVFQETDLDRRVRVSQDHTVSMPLIGVVSVRNKTVRQVESELRALYDRDYLVNPQIDVFVVEYASRTVKVFGQVNRPGEVSFSPEEPMSLLDAIARAGDFTRLANRRKVQLTRTTADGKTEVFSINVDEVIKEGRQWLLQRDDVIRVPEIFL